MLDVTLLPILQDNYAYIIQSAGKTAIIDPGEAGPIIGYLEQQNITPDFIINTHHHWDHTDGNKEISERYNLQIVAPVKEKNKIGRIDIELKDGDVFEFGDTSFKAIETPGHTQGHLCLTFEQDNILFSGDMIFAMGCGRPFEGNAEDLFNSFQKLSHLSDETLIYCGHEYTQTNGNFSLSVEPENKAIQSRAAEVKELRAKGTPTIPTTMGLERKTNLFIRAKNLEEFKDLRNKRNNY
ncbi:MAG: hydroxyacylglutathione hydrolase [Pseudomonadota bacterium]